MSLWGNNDNVTSAVKLPPSTMMLKLLLVVVHNGVPLVQHR